MACSIDSMPIFNAPSSMKNFGEWLAGALSASCPAGVEPTQKTESNGVFAVLPAGVADRLRESFRFYDWDEAAREVRWMCSFDTSEADIDAFAAAIRRELAAHQAGKAG